MRSDTDPFFSKLNMLLKRAGMFNVERVEDIRVLVTGETFFHRTGSVEDFFRRFSDFVADKLNSDLRGFDWAKLIRLYSGNDRHSIDIFIELYEEFSSMS